MSPLLRRRNGSGPEAGLRETVQRQRWQMDLMEESMRALEDAASDGQWRKLGAQLQREFTRSGLDDIIELSRAMYLNHPLIQRAVNITTYYTWGQGVEFLAEDSMMERVVGPMIEDSHNKAELYGHQARLLTDVGQIVDGNVFMALFVDSDPVQVRSIPADEIRAIHRNPEDRNEVWYYRRRWDAVAMDPATGKERVTSREELYPDVGFDPGSARPDSIGGCVIRWDAPVLHQKIGGFKHMSFGVPGTYAALDWARAYRKFLEDWHTIVSSLARFAWRASTKSSKVEGLRSKMSTGITADSAEETNPSVPAGSIWVGTADDQLTPMPKTGTNTSADDARPSRLMVGAAMDLPDTILSGDADVGNLATAKTLDRPTELAMRSRQAMWADWHATLFSAAAAALEKRGILSVPEDERLVQVKFPPILEHDTNATVAALVSAATLDGKLEAGTIPHDELARQLMSAVGVEDVQSALEDLDDEDRSAVDAAVEALTEVLG